MYCRTNNYTYTTYWLILHQLPKTQASNSVPTIDSHFYNSFAWIESNFFHSDCHFSWAWPVSHAHYIRSHSRMGSLRMRLVSRMQLSVNSLYTRSSVSDLLWPQHFMIYLLHCAHQYQPFITLVGWLQMIIPHLHRGIRSTHDSEVATSCM